MLAKAAVLCGKNTIQVRELELPPIGDDELLVKNISNSICLSTYKAALLGEEHKRARSRRCSSISVTTISFDETGPFTA